MRYKGTRTSNKAKKRNVRKKVTKPTRRARKRVGGQARLEMGAKTTRYLGMRQSEQSKKRRASMSATITTPTPSIRCTSRRPPPIATYSPFPSPPKPSCSHPQRSPPRTRSACPPLATTPTPLRSSLRPPPSGNRERMPLWREECSSTRSGCPGLRSRRRGGAEWEKG